MTKAYCNERFGILFSGSENLLDSVEDCEDWRSELLEDSDLQLKTSFEDSVGKKLETGVKGSVVKTSFEESVTKCKTTDSICLKCLAHDPA